MTGDIVEKLEFLVSLDHPSRGGPYGGHAAQECMNAMRDAAQEIKRLREQQEAIDALHKRTVWGLTREGICLNCAYTWPCPTHKILHPEEK